LIQFMDATARGLNTTTEALAAMSAVEQLDYVSRYFQPYAGKLHSLSDNYMAILWPAAIGKPETSIIFPPGSRAYLANRGLDVNHDNAVSKAEAAAFVTKALAEGLLPANASTEAQPKAEAKMGALALLQMFGPILSGLIPQIAGLTKPGSEVAQRNVGIAEAVINTITQAAGQPNLQGAVEAMQADPAVAQKVQEAIVTHADILGLMEIGGGIPAARSFAIASAAESWWRPLVSGAMMICLALLPLVYYTVYKVYTSTGELAFTSEIRASVVSAIISGVLFAIVGFWLGTSYGSQRKTELAAAAK
jgi:hypothetical protein